MNQKKFHGISSASTAPSGHVKHSLWQRLVAPVASITKPSQQRQSSLISALLFVITLAMISGVVYMGFFSSNPVVGYILAGADICMGLAYLLSRTRHYQTAALLSLTVLAIIPVLNVSLGKDHSAEALLILLIWNTLTILLSSAITSMRNTVVFVIVNIFTLSLFPVIIPAVTYTNIAVPLIFNGVISLTILLFTYHRNQIEKDRMEEMARINKQLQVELEERKRAEEQLVHTALHDALTGLPNRVLFLDRLSHVMERARRHTDYMYAVFFLDLDRFKIVNDSLGHNVGDHLLVESAHRLTACLRSEDTVARLGGDEFVILLEDIQDSADAIRVAERIQYEMGLPYDLEGHRVILFVSMGIVLSDRSYKQPDDVLRDADIAMYRAKGKGLGRYEIFDPVMLERVMTRLELETDLRKAVENQEFIIHYQPIIDMKTQQIAGFEALVRWQHPTKGLIPPAEFIPTAEETGLIVPIGYWVMDAACRQIIDWQTQFPSDPPLTINVNLSTRQCAQPDLIEKIKAILQKNKLNPGSLKLELTETLIVEDSVAIANMLSKLRELGVQVQIDDFGTGYSALSYLHKLPIDTLKIDRSFISRLGTNDNSSEIVRTILALAHNLGMKVVAEGVETITQRSNLQALDCEYMQGFLFSKPLDSWDAGKLLGK